MGLKLVLGVFPGAETEMVIVSDDELAELDGEPVHADNRLCFEFALTKEQALGLACQLKELAETM